MIGSRRMPSVPARLAAAGFLSPREEARQLRAAAGADPALLESLLSRRLTGEPLAWITGRTRFCGFEVRISRGVYVPRPQTEQVARRAARLLPDSGTAVDVCTGSGAVALVLAAKRPGARIVATDIDPVAVACAVSNGVDARCGDLFAPLPEEFGGDVDVVVAAPPYVPTSEMRYLQRDTFVHESTTAYDGGEDGGDVLRRVIAGAATMLRRGGSLVMEVGGDESTLIEPDLVHQGFGRTAILVDDEGDVRGVVAVKR